MIFSYDKFSRLEKPTVTLANPDKSYIGILRNYDLKTSLYFNSISEATFTVYKYENKIKTKFYDEIATLKLVEIKYIGWFQITQINKVGDGENERKEITAMSLENELCHILLHSFGEMGIEEVESDNILDMYCLYDIQNQDQSIMHIVTEKAPTWTVGHIDEDIVKEYRTFKNDSVDVYSFLTGDVATAFKCVFQFDTFDKTISAYKLENMGKDTSIFLSYRNLINEITIDEDSSEIKTVMSVVGGDYEGSPLQVSGINPSGNSYIMNVQYFRDNGWFSKALENKYDKYLAKIESEKTPYTNEVEKLKELKAVLYDVEYKKPTKEDDPWSEYGTIALQEAFDKNNKLMSTHLDGNNEAERLKYYNILYGSNGIVENQKIRKAEYETALANVKNQEKVCESHTVDMVTFFGTDLYKELSHFFRYTDYIDDTFVATTAMTEVSRLEMQQKLLENAQEELAKISKPTYTLTINSQNFPAMSKYLKYTEQLYLGNIMTIEFEDDSRIEARLLKIVFDWEDYSNFELVFSSKTSLDDGWVEFSEIQQQASSAATSQAISGIGWNAAKKQNTVVADFMNNALDAAKNKLFAGKNEEFKIDGTGTLWRKWIDAKNDYSPNQMWGTSNGLFLTDSGWSTVDVAIGELNIGKDAYGNDVIMYGIAAPLLLGRITISEQLYIFNDSGTYSMTNDGFIAENTNKTNKLVINPEDNQIFSIYKDSDKVVWFDNAGNAWFKGNVTASEITSSKFTCANDKNSIVIDPSSDQLFVISKEGNPVLYFTKDGNGIFEGSLTVGSIFSKNWLLSGGNESGTSVGTEGTFINLTDGTFHFGGEHLELTDRFLKCSAYSDFTWAGTTYPEARRYVEISQEYVKVQFDPDKAVTDGNLNLFMTPRGIATGTTAEYDPNASNANGGIIDFYSNYLGQADSGNDYEGITIRTRNSPLCLSSSGNVIALNPHEDKNALGAMYIFTVGDNQNGHLKYGDFKSRFYSVGLLFDYYNGELKITRGDSQLGDLVSETLRTDSITLNGTDLESRLIAIESALGL